MWKNEHWWKSEKYWLIGQVTLSNIMTVHFLVKSILVLLFAVSGSYAQQFYPECRTQEHFATMWPDFLDPTRYFLCTGWETFVGRSCAPGTKFSFFHQTCVHPWMWQPPTPPTTTTTQEPTPTPPAPPTAPPTSNYIFIRMLHIEITFHSSISFNLFTFSVPTTSTTTTQPPTTGNF